MTHAQAMNILRREWGDYSSFISGDTEFRIVQAKDWIRLLAQVSSKRFRTRHIVRGIINR